MKEEIKWDGIDGKTFSHSLAAIYEAQMWPDIARHRKEHPNLFKLSVGDKLVGKAIFTSTAGESDGYDSSRDLWNDSDKPSALYRVFRPAYFNPNEDDNEK